MGASQWITYVDYDADAQVAFTRARDATFTAGDYYGANRGKKPANIAAAVRAAGEDGTHSILDLQYLERDPSRPRSWGHMGAASELAMIDLVALFGTDRPTRALVEESRHELTCERGTGRYFVVFDRDRPVAYCFFGVTGD